eukprot:GFUD01053058.1.p1 GENE.GFUD01053058.1~~GFUD01053058.1.p1  ORF type:complete len:171 (+),score=17.36 GFUD01053058.1:62-574(+)
MKYFCLAVALAIVLQAFAEVHADNETEVDADIQTEKPKKCKCCNCCPTGWQKYGTNCYKYFAAPLSWSDAESVCVLHQGWLATIESAGENGFINGIATTDAWIGGFRILPAVSPFWAWVDGSTLSYTNWASGKPDNGGGNQNCVQMYTNGYWDDVGCEVRKAYVCEKRMF